MDSLKQSIEALIAERDDAVLELARALERGSAMLENSVAKAVYDLVKIERDHLSGVVAEQATRIGELHVQLAHTRNTIRVLHAQIEALR